MPSIAGCTSDQSPSGCDHTWAANWDSSQGVTSSGALAGVLLNPGQSTYGNGTAATRDLYFRFQIYFTPNWVWPGDPKTDKYGYSSGNSFDNKIFYVYNRGSSNPTNGRIDAGPHTQSGTYDPITNAGYADTLAFRYGDAGGPYKMFPLCNFCQTAPKFFNYAPYQCTANTPACWRNPNDQPLLGRPFRFNTGRWYTLEFRYVVATGAGVPDGLVQAWIDGTMIYDQGGLATCGGGDGDCAALGSFHVLSYHNGSDPTNWNGQQVFDNLIISKAYIGPPSGGTPGDITSPTTSLTAPTSGSTVSGSSVSVSANASDNIGVSGVQFLLDGANLQTEDTTSPYSITWNTTITTNGSHTITARARDAAGNTTTSSSVTITVNN
ncbi:MAG: Ig-like domain-containing protein, partial [Patescibacteria group bacterium]